jgi:hypothetical protein
VKIVDKTPPLCIVCDLPLKLHTLIQLRGCSDLKTTYENMKRIQAEQEARETKERNDLTKKLTK